MKIFPTTQRDYDEEAELLVTVLKRWYDLQNKVNHLEWELNRCEYPEAPARPAPPPANKPDVLLRAEAGKPLIPEKKQGRKQSWADRYDRVKSHREFYEQKASRLDDRVQRLTMRLADCKEAQERAAQGPAAEEMDPLFDQVKKVFEKAQALDEASGPEAPPDAAPPPSTELDRLHRDVKRAQSQHRALQDEKAALVRRLTTLQHRADEMTERFDRKEQALAAARAEIARLEEQHEQTQKRFDALEILGELARRFLQGQRSFLFLHNNPQLENALAGLVDYSIARLAIALVSNDTPVVLAMVANLDRLANKLKTYNGKPIHGFEEALAVLGSLQPERDDDEAGAARSLPGSTEKQRPTARPFVMRLKHLRDVARVELRPFYYLDDQNHVQRIG